MKTLLLATVCFILIAVIFSSPNEETYTDQFDSINVDEILQSDRLLNNYFSCLKTGKKCTSDGQKLKEFLPDALKTNCKKCTEVQKEQSRKIIIFLIKNKYQMFKELEDIYDPEQMYRKMYADELKKEGIVFPD